METRDEILEAVGVRCRSAPRAEKNRILTEFAEIAGYHRKHAERLLRREHFIERSRPRPERRMYDDAVREALVVLWEASDRICGKRLKPLIPFPRAQFELLERQPMICSWISAGNLSTPTQPRPISDLKANECRWPINDPEDAVRYLFCAQPVKAPHSYCPDHCRRAFIKGPDA